MKLTQYDPWHALSSVPEEMERLMRRRFGSLAPAEDGEEGLVAAWAPAVDIREDDDQFVVHADIPGVEPKDIDVSLENGMLTISGERKEEKEDEKEGYRRMERFSGQFFRRFSLPDTADADKVKARSRKGVLELVIPKTREHQARRIEVEAD